MDVLIGGYMAIKINNENTIVPILSTIFYSGLILSTIEAIMAPKLETIPQVIFLSASLTFELSIYFRSSSSPSD